MWSIKWINNNNNNKQLKKFFFFIYINKGLVMDFKTIIYNILKYCISTRSSSNN